jgi:hypothetical protein
VQPAREAPPDQPHPSVYPFYQRERTAEKKYSLKQVNGPLEISGNREWKIPAKQGVKQKNYRRHGDSMVFHAAISTRMTVMAAGTYS